MRRARSAVIASARSRSAGSSKLADGRVDRDDLAGQLRALAPDPLLGAHRVGAAPAHHRGEPGQRLQGGRPAGAVGRDADVALEVAHGLLGLVAVAAVDLADLEAEVEQPLLECDHVVAGEHVARDVGQQPVAEPPPGLLQHAVGARTDDAVDGQAALLLELADRPVEALVERVGAGLRRDRVGRGAIRLGRCAGVAGTGQAEERQARPDLRDRCSAVAESEDRWGSPQVGHPVS